MKRVTFYFGLLALLLSLNVVLSDAHAQTNPQASEIEAIFACKTKSDPMERLACYDLAAGRLETAQNAGDIVTVSKQDIEKVQEDSFGFNIPSLPKLGSLFKSKPKTPKVETSKSNDLIDPVQNEEVIKEAASGAKTETPLATQEVAKAEKEKISQTVEKEDGVVTAITSDITRTQTFGYKKTRFFLANGQVWEQTDSNSVRIPKARNGKTPFVVIRKASLGSFLLSVNDNGRAIRAKRVR